MPEPSRDYSVWRAIVDALDGTSEFAAVLIGEKPSTHTAFGAGDTPAAVITPSGGSEIDPWDDTSDVRSIVEGRFTLTIVVRDDDPSERFDRLDRLFQASKNAINGQLLAGLTIPGRTRLGRWSYQQPNEPEKHLVIEGEYVYHVEGYGGHDETEWSD